jgi:hypothetical protein
MADDLTSRRLIIPIVLFGIVAVPAVAAAGDGWDYTLAPYLWAAGLDGTIGKGPASAEVDASFADVFENLELGGMIHFEAEGDRWLILADGLFIGLGQSSDRPRADVDVDQAQLELAAAYKAGKRFELLVGGRYTSLEAEVDIFGPVGLRIQEDHDWLDPFVGARLRVPVGGTWTVTARGDVGGFGVGSELTWNAAVHLAVRTSDNLSLAFGYRFLDVDFEEGSGLTRFVYDVQTHGPQVGVGIHF